MGPWIWAETAVSILVMTQFLGPLVPQSWPNLPRFPCVLHGEVTDHGRQGRPLSDLGGGQKHSCYPIFLSSNNTPRISNCFFLNGEWAMSWLENLPAMDGSHRPQCCHQPQCQAAALAAGAAALGGDSSKAGPGFFLSDGGFRPWKWVKKGFEPTRTGISRVDIPDLMLTRLIYEVV